MTWAGRRQTFILGGLALIIIAILLPILKRIVAPVATCSDNRQNQGEKGVYCPGPCKKVCAFEPAPVKVLWVRAFKIADGVYNAVAYITNPNAEFAIKKGVYHLKLFDERNILIAERKGEIDIPSKVTMPVFESSIVTEKAIVSQAFFDLNDDLNWQRGGETKKRISVGAPVFDSGSNPKIRATVQNNTLETLRKIPFVVIVFDSKGNALASSETIVDLLGKNEKVEIVFTWQAPFERAVGPIEIYPQISD